VQSLNSSNIINKEQAKRFSNWLLDIKNKNLLIIEIGAGFNTPGVIRWPMEQIVYTHPNAYLIRVNLDYPQIPKEIADRSLSLQCSAKSFLNEITVCPTENQTF